MAFKIFPNPSKDICTPFIHANQENTFCRLHQTDSYTSLVSIIWNYQTGDMNVSGIEKEKLLGSRLPNRDDMLRYLKRVKLDDSIFARYVHEHYIIPVFSLSIEEAYVKVVIRQLINAKHAKRIYSEFIKKFGVMENKVYGFPNCNLLSEITLRELLDLGIGFKAERLFSGIRLLHMGEPVNQLKGIGPWSSGILEMEQHKSYAFYPFWDKSGEKIKETCYVDLLDVAKKNRILAGDLYVYAASYLEAERLQ
jgi:hypothetical protein